MSIENLNGQTLGQYELRDLLGVGGMGAVYRAYQPNLRRMVAVKILKPELSGDPGYVERFTREARTSAALEHPHIVHVYDYGTQREVSYLVTQLLGGGSLSQRMTQRAGTEGALPSLGEAAELLRQVSSALDYAHNQGVIHRDIKPSNIMFDNHGNACVVDFGIAKLLASSTVGLTGVNAVVGTFGYMAPEQWLNAPLSPATDQYALGVAIYALVAGRLPFDAQTPAGCMHGHLNERPRPLEMWRSNIPEALTYVVERALAKRPEERFPTCTAFADAFRRAAAGCEDEKTGFFTAPVQHHSAPSSVFATPARSSTQTAAPLHKAPAFWVLVAVIAVMAGVIAYLALSLKGPAATGGEPPGVGAIPTPTTDDPPPQPPPLVVLSTPVPPPTLTPTGTPTETPTLTPTARPVAISISSISLDEAAWQIVIGVLTEDQDRIDHYELQVSSADNGQVVGNYVYQPPPYDQVRVPLADLSGGVYSPLLRAFGPGGGLLAEAAPVEFAYTPPPTPTRTTTRTPYPTVTRTATRTATRTPTATPMRTPTATLTPSPTRTPRPATPIPAGTSNRSWAPVIDELNGVPMAYVPAGCFRMGSSQGYDDERPVHDVCLDAFWIGQTEVTNAQYRACVQAGACSAPVPRWFYDDPAYSAYPVAFVDWNQARRYAAWAGGALPTEAQWEYAARGPQGWTYPWGDIYSSLKLNADGVGDGYTQLALVGSFPSGASWVGALDLSGNVREWTSSAYRSYPYQAGDGRENPEDRAAWRVLRGGSWNDLQYGARAAYRGAEAQSVRYASVGFRVVLAAAPDARTQAESHAAASPATPIPADTSNRIWTPVVSELNGAPMAYVPAGCFKMGSSDNWDDERPVHEVCLGAFWIGQTEVTNAQYRACVEAGACSPPNNRKYYDDRTYSAHPVTAVDWSQAYQYAAWAGGALPTEAQWEYAARGPEGWKYPWGTTFGARLNYCDARCTKEQRDAASDDGFAELAPVGSFSSGASWVGALDLSGNVWEWTSSANQSYPYRVGDGRENPDAAVERVVRGGSWANDEEPARAAYRNWADPNGFGDLLGFRVAIAVASGAAAPPAPRVAVSPTPRVAVSPTPRVQCTVATTGNRVNVRARPDANSARISQVPFGTVMDVLLQQVGADGFAWFSVAFSIGGSSFTGWIRGDYVQPIGGTVCPSIRME